ncbi:Uncharacterised protein [Listeria newyorkensis]|nr:Uncharacterised protein [Listeria newyorkensis]
MKKIEEKIVNVFVLILVTIAFIGIAGLLVKGVLWAWGW